MALADDDIDRVIADHGIRFCRRRFTSAVTRRTFFDSVVHAGASDRIAWIRLSAARLSPTRHCPPQRPTRHTNSANEP